MGLLSGVQTTTKRSFNRALNNNLSEKGVKTVKSTVGNFKNSFDTSIFSSAGLLAYGGATLFGTNLRVSGGESFLPALGKEMVEDAMFAVAPELLVGLIGSAVAKSYPKLNVMAEQKKRYALNYSMLGGNYIDQQADHMGRQRAMEHIKRTRSTLARSMGGEARRYHSS